MSLVRLENVSKLFSGEPVLSEVNLRIEEGERIALIGRNGTGKTTLFRLIVGDTEPDGGVIECMRRARIIYLEQIPQATPGTTVMEIALTPFAELLQMEEQLHALELKMADGSEAALAAYGEYQHEFTLKGGYEFRTRVRQILGGLGFSNESFDLPFEALSGGWRARLMLSLSLLQEADLLLLDEPENHLDMDAREWLEEHIQSRPEAVVLISHDRRMVNVLAKRILEVERGVVTSYTGNYDAWLKEKALRREQQQKAFDRQDAFIKKEQAWIDRFRYKNTKASLAQSRLKRLEKLELVDAPESDMAAVTFKMGKIVRTGETVVDARDLSMAYDHTLYADLSLSLHRGERLGIIGPNGSGKTTLLRQLAGRHKGNGGEVRLGHNVKHAFYDQHQQELHHGNDLLTEMQAYRPDWTALECRNYLAQFLFRGDDVFKPIAVLSGGERSRLALAKLIASDANLLFLDEPTNHLDMASREALEASLDDFPGAILVVSHDRTLIDRLVERLLIIENGRAHLFPGNFSEYRRWKRENPEYATDSSDDTASETKKKNLEEREQKKAQEREARRGQRQVEQLEAAIAKLEAEIKEVHGHFATLDPTDYERGKELTGKYESLQEELNGLYEQWAELADG